MSNIKTLSNNAFAGCSSLKSIVLPNSLESIGSSMFDGCTSLVTVHFPSEYPQKRFPGGIFKNCSSLTSLIEIPATVTEIGQAAFWGCRSLEGIKMLGSTPPSPEYGVFNDTTFPIYVPNDAIQKYKSAWNALQSRIIGY